MLVIKGSGGEGKSQIVNVLSKLFGAYAKDGSVGKISENRFARADLEHVLLMMAGPQRLLHHGQRVRASGLPLQDYVRGGDPDGAENAAGSMRIQKCKKNGCF